VKSDLNPELHDAEQFIYQQQHISEKEYKFLKELEHVLGECIPCLNEIQWGDMHYHSFGFVVKDDHIMGLGLTMKLIREIPKSISSLTHLEILTIDKCVNLHSLPESIIYLKNLKYFQFDIS
jgi:hypothetical protein